MHGQWIGQYSGSNFGTAVLDIDDREDHYEGYAYALDSNPQFPSSYVFLRTPDKSNPCAFKASIFPMDRNGNPSDWQTLSAQFPGVVFPESADVSAEWNRQRLAVNWTTNVGTYGSAELPITQPPEPSDYQAQPMLWAEFKSHIEGLSPRRFMFRGQEEPWRLRTRFHRTGRADLRRFLVQDI